MISETTEKISINILEREILRYPECLSPYLSSNDKTPSWDGHIYLYNNSEHTIKNFRGRIDTQVKGRKVEKLSKGNSKFTISVDTLNAYRKLVVGTLLIVVDFIDLDNYQLYYANLLPVDLIEIFQTIKPDQKNKTLTLKPITPKSASSLKNICLNFFKDSCEQANRRLIDYSELKDVEQVSFEIIGSNNEIIEYMKNNRVYTYGIMKNTKEKVNMPAFLDFTFSLSGNCMITLENGAKEKYIISQNTSLKDENVVIGNSVIINKNTKKLSINLKGNIYERIKDLKLLIYVLKYQNFIINDKVLDFPLISDEAEKSLPFYIDLLDKYTKIKNAFEYFNINFDVKMESLTKKDINNMNCFVGLFYGKYLDKIDKCRFYNIKISNYTLYIIPKIENAVINGIYNLFENLDDKLSFSVKIENNKIINTSIYYMLTTEVIKSASNFNCDVIFDNIKNNGMNLENCDYCNQFILNLILVYDETKKSSYLELADKLTNELLKIKPENIYLLNKYQIKYRIVGLTKEEKLLIKEIYDKGDAFIKCGASILLDNKTDYELNLDELTKEEKDIILKSPIVNLIK